MSETDAPAGSGWALIQEGLQMQKKEYADMQQKLAENEKKHEANHQQVRCKVKTFYPLGPSGVERHPRGRSCVGHAEK